MSIEKTMEAYREEKLNCAQSVLRGFQNACGIGDAAIAEAKKNGGGRAEGGCCGALHSALQLARSEAVRQQLLAAFRAEAGAIECAAIRQQHKLSCPGCVELAAGILEKNL